jgi:hypothetical protein
VDRRLGLVIEAESYEFHADPAAFAQDVRRYTLFVRHGHVVLRFTWQEVMHDPDHVRAVLAEVVAWGPWGRWVTRVGGAVGPDDVTNSPDRVVCRALWWQRQGQVVAGLGVPPLRSVWDPETCCRLAQVSSDRAAG